MTTAILPPQSLLRRRFDHETLAPHPLSAPHPSSHLNRHACSATADRRRKRNPPDRRRKHNPADRRRKRNPPDYRSAASGGRGGGSRSRCTAVESPAASSTLVNGQVKILKRGETLSELQKKGHIRDRESTSTRWSAMRMTGRCSEDLDLVLGSTGRIGPDPDTVQKQIGACKGFEIVAGSFAGACCSVSPPPSSVPIPEFLEKKNKRVV